MLIHSETARIGKKGVLTIPASMRRHYGLNEGSLVVAEEREDGILLRPAIAMPIEVYHPDRIAEFMLSNATNAEDYAAALHEVIEMGLNPDTIKHQKPNW